MANETTNQPTHGVYIVESDGKDSKGFWTKVGSAWQNRDGKGFSVKLTALPLDGRLVIRENKAKPEAGQ